MTEIPRDERALRDTDVFNALDRTRGDLAEVRRAFEAGDLPDAKRLLVEHFRVRQRPRWFFDLPDLQNERHDESSDDQRRDGQTDPSNLKIPQRPLSPRQGRSRDLQSRRHRFRDAVTPLFDALYESVKNGTETQIAIEANSAPDYAQKLRAELDEIKNSEMWRAGAAVRGLRPENWGK